MSGGKQQGSNIGEDWLYLLILFVFVVIIRMFQVVGFSQRRLGVVLYPFTDVVYDLFGFT